MGGRHRQPVGGRRRDQQGPAGGALTTWGDEHDAPAGPRRLLWHAGDEGLVDASGRCTRCGASGPARDTVVAPGPGLDLPGLESAEPAQDAVSMALTRPHRLLEPLRHA
jgi:hypothetical protein